MMRSLSWFIKVSQSYHMGPYSQTTLAEFRVRRIYDYSTKTHRNVMLLVLKMEEGGF